MVELKGLETVASPIASGRSPRLSYRKNGGAEGTRTPDFLLAKEALSRLSYSPMQLPEL